MPKTGKIKALTRQLREYMEFRAKEEGVNCELDEEFFLAGLKAGVRNFFGITLDVDSLTGDFQNPAAFAKWQATRKDV